MGNGILNKAWTVRGLTSTQKLVLVNLCDRASEEGDNLFVSHNAIAAETCLKRAATQRAIQALLAKGLLAETSREAGGVVHYRVVLSALPTTSRWTKRRAPKRAKAGSERSTNAMDRKDPPPVSERSTSRIAEIHGVDRKDPQTVREPVNEPDDVPSTSAIERVLNGFATIYKQHRHATFMAKQGHAAVATELLKAFSAERILELAGELLTLPAGVDEWIDKTDRGLEILKHRATWLDERLVTKRAVRGGCTCKGGSTCAACTTKRRVSEEQRRHELLIEQMARLPDEEWEIQQQKLEFSDMVRVHAMRYQSRIHLNKAGVVEVDETAVARAS